MVFLRKMKDSLLFKSYSQNNVESRAIKRIVDKYEEYQIVQINLSEEHDLAITEELVQYC